MRQCLKQSRALRCWGLWRLQMCPWTPSNSPTSWWNCHKAGSGNFTRRREITSSVAPELWTSLQDERGLLLCSQPVFELPSLSVLRDLELSNIPQMYQENVIFQRPFRVGNSQIFISTITLNSHSCTSETTYAKLT